MRQKYFEAHIRCKNWQKRKNWAIFYWIHFHNLNFFTARRSTCMLLLIFVTLTGFFLSLEKWYELAYHRLAILDSLQSSSLYSSNCVFMLSCKAGRLEEFFIKLKSVLSEGWNGNADFNSTGTSPTSIFIISSGKVRVFLSECLAGSDRRTMVVRCREFAFLRLK